MHVTFFRKACVVRKVGFILAFIFCAVPAWAQAVSDGMVREFFDDGRVKIEKAFQRNKLNGSFREYYPDGKIMSVGTYKDGLLEGPFKSYYSDGTLFMEKNYVNGLQHGVGKEFFETGNPKSVEGYRRIAIP